MKGYKGFDKDLKCRGYQYEVGKTYEHKGDIEICESGFHFCENPFDVWDYYPLANGNRFATVSGTGNLSTHDDDTKVACSSLEIQAEISLRGMIEGAVKFIFSKAKKSKKSSATTGDRANSATTGYRAHSATTGDRAHSAVGHKNAIAAALGIESSAKGVLGSWIVVAEWIFSDEWTVKNVKAIRVDGKKIKADTPYMLKDGKFVEVK